MKNFSFVITKSAVFQEVALNTAYTGAKADSDKPIFSRVSTIDADDELLSRLWRNATGELIEKLREFIDSSQVSETGLTINMKLSNAYDESLSPVVEADVFAFFVAAVTAEWMAFALPSLADDWRTKAAELLNRILANICYRKKPSRSLL